MTPEPGDQVTFRDAGHKRTGIVQKRVIVGRPNGRGLQWQCERVHVVYEADGVAWARHVDIDQVTVIFQNAQMSLF